MDSFDTLNDSENWTPIYESATWPTVSALSPFLLFGLVFVPAAAVRKTNWQYGIGLSEISGTSITHLSESEETFAYYQSDSSVNQLLVTTATKEPDVRMGQSSAQETLRDMLQGLSLVGLARAAFPEIRQMEDWEQKATDRFFLSHFK